MCRNRFIYHQLFHQIANPCVVFLQICLGLPLHVLDGFFAAEDAARTPAWSWGLRNIKDSCVCMYTNMTMMYTHLYRYTIYIYTVYIIYYGRKSNLWSFWAISLIIVHEFWICNISWPLLMALLTHISLTPPPPHIGSRVKMGVSQNLEYHQIFQRLRQLLIQFWFCPTLWDDTQIRCTPHVLKLWFSKSRTFKNQRFSFYR